LKYGLFYELETPSDGSYTEEEMWSAALDQLEAGERAGFDSAWAVEHHFTPGYSHSTAPEVFFAAASQRTKTMRLGPGICLLPFNNPIRTAEQWAAVDLLSHGRVEMGVGRGATQIEFDTFHQPSSRGPTNAENRELFFEYIEIIKKCWTEDNFTFDGRFYQIPQPISVVPKPVQKPYPRFWAAAGSPDSFEVYAHHGMHLLVQNAVTPIHMLGDNLARARKAWAAAGHGPEESLELSCLIPVHCAPTTEQAIAQMRDYELEYYTQLKNFFSPKSVADLEERKRPEGVLAYWENPSWDYIYESKMVICGDPDDCAEVVQELADAGVTRVLAQFQVGGMPHAMVMEAIKLFGETVIPRTIPTAAEKVAAS
jgi:alkanesulfonate monooxygenase SsuD/methylene tetrahydromethanopterin reductase-like flavin-dependent oxidoreductase (luciferase family)